MRELEVRIIFSDVLGVKCAVVLQKHEERSKVLESHRTYHFIKKYFQALQLILKICKMYL